MQVIFIRMRLKDARNSADGCDDGMFRIRLNTCSYILQRVANAMPLDFSPF